MKGEGRKVNGSAVDYLIKLNDLHSQGFCSPESVLERALYRERHPTEVAAGKCMDGRVNLAYMTQTALGIIQSFRNIGGRFSLGWPLFADKIREWVEYSISRRRQCLYLSTYHYAKGDTHRGCAGFGYDTEKAIASALGIKTQFREDFGRSVVYPVTLGIETDGNGLVLHGERLNGNPGEVVRLWELEDTTEAYLVDMLARLYPHMPEQTLRDFLPLIQGNLRHMIEVQDRPTTEVVHKEFILGVGRGFDWLHEPNIALLVGPFDPDMDEAVATAARLIKANLDEGRLDDGQEIVLLSSKPYRRIGPEQKLAERAARLLSDRTLSIVEREVPALLPRLKRLTVSVDMTTRKFNVLHRS